MSHPRLSLDGMSCRIGGRSVLEPLSLALEPGRFIALIGPNGAGKSTLLRAIAGLVPIAGQVSLDGRALAGLTLAERARRIGYLPQGQAIHWPLTVRDVVALGRYPHGLADPEKADATHARAIEAAMTRTGCLPFADRAIQTLSGGERARVLLARALAVEAAILLADEPIAALDPRHQLIVMQDLKAESRRGTLVIAVTHDLGLAARLADEIILLDRGRMIAHGAPADVLTDARIESIYGVNVLRQTYDGEEFLIPREAL